MIRNYARDNIDVFHTPLSIFGPNSDAPIEMPIFQALAALFARSGLDPGTAGRLLALISFQVSAVLLFVLINRWRGQVEAVLAVCLMQFMPFGLAWGAACLIDFMSVALSLGMVLGLDSYLRREAWTPLVLGSVCAWLALLVKVTTPIPWFFMLVAVGVALGRTRWKSVGPRWATFFLLGPGVGLLGARLWTSYADSIKAASVQTQFLVSSQLQDWNFGTLVERADPFMNAVLLERFIGTMWPTPIGLALALLPCLVARRGARIYAWGLMGTAIAGPLVFFNLYAVHEYYLIAIYPAACALLAMGVCELSGLRIAKATSTRMVAAIGGVGLLLVALCGRLGSADLQQFATPTAPPTLAAALAAQTRPNDLVLTVGCDWDPLLLYYADRKGLMVRTDDPGLRPSAAEISSYPVVVACEVDPNTYLPAGYMAQPTSTPSIFRVISTRQ